MTMRTSNTVILDLQRSCYSNQTTKQSHVFKYIVLLTLFCKPLEYKCELHLPSYVLSGKLTFRDNTLGKKATIHQVIAMLSTSKNVLFPGHNHLLTTSRHLLMTQHFDYHLSGSKGNNQSEGSSAPVVSR